MFCRCSENGRKKALMELLSASESDSFDRGTFTYDVCVGNTEGELDVIDVESKKEKYKNTIFLDMNSVSVCGDVVFHSVQEDSFDRYRSNEWRNTSEKVNKIKSYLAEKVYLFFGLVDIQGKHIYNYLSKENIKLLMSQGWKFENYDENAKE